MCQGEKNFFFFLEGFKNQVCFKKTVKRLIFEEFMDFTMNAREDTT